MLARALGVAIGGLITSGALVAAADAQADGFVIVAAAQSSSSSRDAFAPAARLDPPAHVRVDPPLPPAGPNESTCRSDLPDAVMKIVIADIGYVCPLYPGGQGMLDAGAATIISDPVLTSTLAVHPGDPGTLWVAGHRASHGGPFAAIPSLSVGALVILDDGRLAASYQVVGIERFEVRNDKVVDSSGNATSAATLDSILRPDGGAQRAPRLLIQTCDGSTARWMVYADLVSLDASGS